MENEDLYRNLVILLKMFKNRPYHLAKYLIENSALTPEFIKKVSENGKLTNLSEENDDKSKQPIYFLDIGKMNDYYSSFTDDIKLLEKGKTPSEIEADFNEKLNKLLMEEKYEDAARVRDYMAKNKIKRIK
jgi:hypothetical protein